MYIVHCTTVYTANNVEYEYELLIKGVLYYNNIQQEYIYIAALPLQLYSYKHIVYLFLKDWDYGTYGLLDF